MKKNQIIALYGIGIALYVVLSAFVNIPIVNRIKLDLGYIIFAIYLANFGMSATIVGVAGCIIAELLKGGSLRIAWPIGQTFIGLTLGYLYPKTKNSFLKALYTVIAVFIGIGLIKTVIEVAMYQFPLEAKFLSNSVAFLIDAIAMIIGVLLGNKVRIKKQ
ncbi:MAG: ECF transporter S component [Erysipelotrichaceae bacterium]|nr:ECF transporter S component [Erysipelotrichaceae bacterium]